MQLERIAVVGSGGLLGEIMEVELARYGPVTNLSSIQQLISSAAQPLEVIAIWAADAFEIGRARMQLRRTLPASHDPLLVFLNQSDPYIYFTRVRALHVDRRRLGFNQLLDEIAGRVTTGLTTITPARAGHV